MNTYYTLISLALILLFNHSSFAYRIHPYPYEQYQGNVQMFKRMMLVPSESDIAGTQYILRPLDRNPNERVPRGWGSGRRRRSINTRSNNDD